MNKTKQNILIIIIIVLGIVILSSLLIKKEEVKFINNSDNLYDVSIKYLIDEDNSPNKAKQKYKLFIDYEKFGIAKDKNYRYAYMWVVKDSRYLKNGKITNGEGSSMPYKFIIHRKKDKVIKYINPEDGNEYKSSIKTIFPKKISDKILNYRYESNKLEEEINNYYSNENIK